MDFTLEDFLHWRNQSVTKFLLKEISVEIEEEKEAWASGALTTESTDGTIQKNSHALGRVDALKGILEKIEEIKAAKKEEANDSAVRMPGTDTA